MIARLCCDGRPTRVTSRRLGLRLVASSSSTECLGVYISGIPLDHKVGCIMLSSIALSPGPIWPHSSVFRAARLSLPKEVPTFIVAMSLNMCFTALCVPDIES